VEEFLHSQNLVFNRGIVLAKNVKSIARGVRVNDQKAWFETGYRRSLWY
jgi:hypothetical protein